MNTHETINRWNLLLNDTRRKTPDKKKTKKSTRETRTEIERDYDRILFSTPVRRLADKTQVFPLEKNDSVRTRLTHSHEVSNLARSIGTALAFQYKIGKDVRNYQRNLPALLAAIGLVHDLGNPPFGHQGEAAIRSWFSDHRSELLERHGLNHQQKQDFLNFEGNAQAFRLVTRLQLLNDNYGLDLTYATLAAMMKYPTGSDQINKTLVATKKHGFFASEQHIAQDVFQQTGIAPGIRHPLAYLMEACDDIAYVVLDVEDAVKKGLASFHDLIAYIKHKGKGDNIIKRVARDSEKKHEEYRMEASLSPLELNDISMQRFRVYAIHALVNATIDAFLTNSQAVVSGTLERSILSISSGAALREHLKAFGEKYAYKSRSVLKSELTGYNVIRRLMDIFWDAIVNRESHSKVDSSRLHPYSRFVYGRISENYRRIFESPPKDMSELPIRYRECLLLTDMISGMTDSFAISLKEELDSLIGTHRLVRSV